MKTCCKCKQAKLDDQFYVIKKTGKLRPYCNPCQKIISAESYKRNPNIKLSIERYRNRPENIDRQRERVRNWHYKTHYGFSEADKRSLEAKQGNRCAICKTHFSEMIANRVHVDHCHRTGLVRGILCHNCNQVLGQSRDNPSVLVSAIEYLADAESKSMYDQGRDAFA